PEAMWVWLHTIRQNGTTLLSSPMPKKPRHAAPSGGSLSPTTRNTPARITAARPTRSVTMVSGGSAASATPAKKNELPHSTDMASSIAHSSPVIAWWIGPDAAARVDIAEV